MINLPETDLTASRRDRTPDALPTDTRLVREPFVIGRGRSRRYLSTSTQAETQARSRMLLDLITAAEAGLPRRHSQTACRVISADRIMHERAAAECVWRHDARAEVFIRKVFSRYSRRMRAGTFR